MEAKEVARNIKRYGSLACLASFIYSLQKQKQTYYEGSTKWVREWFSFKKQIVWALAMLQVWLPKIVLNLMLSWGYKALVLFNSRIVIWVWDETFWTIEKKGIQDFMGIFKALIFYKSKARRKMWNSLSEK